MGRKKSNSKGILFTALGLGLIISLVLPEKFIIVLLAVSLVACGLSLCK